MISKSDIGSAAATAAYHTQKSAVVEYYAGQPIPSGWGGRGADFYQIDHGKTLAEAQAVDGKMLQNALEGWVRDASGEVRQLGRKGPGGEWEHRAGWDFTVAAPKSVSIVSEVFGRDDVRQAHEHAANAAMRFLETHGAQTRISGEHVATKNLLYAHFSHSNSRELDPQTHTHFLIANATFDEKSGRWYSLSNEKLFELRATADAVYKNELAHALQGMGYRLDMDGAGGFEIAGFTPDQLAEFSERSAQIDAWLQQRGIDPETASYQARLTACLDTRQGKDGAEGAEAQREQWQQRAGKVGIVEPQRDLALAREARAESTAKAASAAVAKALSHITERESAFRTKDLFSAAAAFSQGRADQAAIEKEIAARTRSGQIIEREDGKLTTEEMVKAERFMVDRIEAGKGEHAAVMTKSEFSHALAAFEARKGFELTPEQRAAAAMILASGDRFQGVQGLAGTGKTTMLEFVREAAEAKGWKIVGFSNGSEQAAKMEQESGIASTTTARHLIDEGQAGRDADLARRALETHDFVGGKADLKRLQRQAGTQTEFDSQGRRYLVTADGAVYAASLYRPASRELESANLNHLGLTSTRYILADDGQVFKQGGTLTSEAAGAAHQQIAELLGHTAGRVAGVMLKDAENWRPASIAETLAVRGELAQRNMRALSQEVETLRALAERGGQVRELRIMDEASQSGQREFNRVIEAAEAAGARVVFLGDKLQHQGVEAGRAFEKAQAALPQAELGRESIRRQTTKHMKTAVAQILDRQHGQALRALETREARPAQDAIRAKYEGREGRALTPKEQQTMREQLRDAAKQDNKTVIQSLAKDYAGMTAQERRETLVLTATNADREAINAAIRDQLKARGDLGDGKTIQTLDKLDRSEAQIRQAASYQKGEIVKFGANYKSLDVRKGETGMVIRTDARHNTVMLRMEDGREVFARADKARMQSYQATHREFSQGDRVRFTENQQNDRVSYRNGQTGTVEKIEGDRMAVRLDNGKQIELDTKTYRTIEHAYSTTSHAAQGQTVKQVFIHHNTESGRHGDRETYVNITRAREDARVYTQDAAKAERQAGVELQKEEAMISKKPHDHQADLNADRQASEREATEDRREQETERRTSEREQPAAERDIEHKETERDAQAQQAEQAKPEAENSQSEAVAQRGELIADAPEQERDREEDGPDLENDYELER
ncbi:MAG: relaxase domain-containing protein [Betaproteobacteria bacterium]|nr:relaxase domain-containing protein [Betaproteobacteria bacterium]